MMVGTDDVPAGRVLTVDDLERIRARRHYRTQAAELEQLELERRRRNVRMAAELLELDDAGVLELPADQRGELTRIVAEGGEQ